jgi:NAD(P)H-hydrate epimerase
MHNSQEIVPELIVTALQMREIEERIFAAGMPVAALMEKVGGLITRRIQDHYPDPQQTCFGVLVGPGHNGGDALVIARELHFRGYGVRLYQPFSKLKELTAAHAAYANNLGIPKFSDAEPLQSCDVLIDGLFGFGLERTLEGAIAETIHHINKWGKPVFSIDLPSGLHTDTGEVLGVAIRATQTFCLGLWKLGLLQDQALEHIGTAELIDFGLPLTDIRAVLGERPELSRITSKSAIAQLPLKRPAATHKYNMGHVLLICGSRRYMGAAILAGLGAKASGVGMLSMAVPESAQPVLMQHLPDAVVMGCPETETGALKLTDEVVMALKQGKYSAIACGPGLTQEVTTTVEAVLSCPCPLVLDADGLNILATLDSIPTLTARSAPTVLTPHAGEFKRLFPELATTLHQRIQVVKTAAAQTGAIVLLKGARVAIAEPLGHIWINPESTPALARGGSGDVLTGLIAGLLAQQVETESAEKIAAVVASAVWWHAQAGIKAAQERTVLGVDAFTLSQFLGLLPALWNCSKIE